jgi:hypothetical protein
MRAVPTRPYRVVNETFRATVMHRAIEMHHGTPTYRVTEMCPAIATFHATGTIGLTGHGKQINLAEMPRRAAKEAT